MNSGVLKRTIRRFKSAAKIAIPGFLPFVLFGLGVPFHKYRIGYFHTDRVGHFVCDSAIRFAETGGKEYAKEIYWIEPTASNDFWPILLGRNFHISRSRFLGAVIKLARVLPVKPRWYVAPYRDTQGSRDLEGFLTKSDFQMRFTEEENKLGRDWLESVGCLPGQPFVCLMVRDSNFLDTDGPHNADVHKLPEDYWSYHNYRDSDVSTFARAAEWLASQGVFVLRMGKAMAKKFVTNRPEVIDYAFREDRSDFLDAWLFANCALCVSTGTGAEGFAVVFSRPVVLVNFLPLTQALTYGPSLTAAKALYNQAGERLGLQEMMDVDLYGTDEYSEAGLSIRDLSPDEILEVVKEGWERIDGLWEDAEGDKARQKEFHAAIRGSKASRYHNYLHPEARLSSVWLNNLDRERGLPGAGNGS